MRTMRATCRGLRGATCALFLGILLELPTLLFAQGASALLRLVPPESPLILTVENLREHYPAIISSPLAEGLMKLPAVREWAKSARSRKLISARDRIEAFLGTPVAELRNQIFGDAVVLAVEPNSIFQPRAGRVTGVILLRARNRELLRRLVRLIDDAQVAGGDLARCVERREGDASFIVREYPAEAGRSNEYHVDFPDGTFALSNSESMIRDVIARRRRIDSADAGIKELAAAPKFKTVARGLVGPDRAVCRLFIDRPLIERVANEINTPSQSTNARLMAIIARYLSAIDYAGASLSWRDGVLALQSAESLAPARLDPAIVRWANDPRPVEPNLAMIPATAFAFASSGIDLGAFDTLLGQLISDEERPRFETFEIALSGILLGQDLRQRIFPSIGPSWIAYFDAPPDNAPTPRFISEIPLVVAASLRAEIPKSESGVTDKLEREGEPPAVTVESALDNAIRTILALGSIDHKRNKGRNRLVTRDVAGSQVNTLDPPVSFAYSLDRVNHRLALGNSADAVAAYLDARTDPSAGVRFRKILEIAVPVEDNATPRTFLGLDIRALHALADRRRDQLAGILTERRQRPQADPTNDLDQVLAILRLFDSAFATSRLSTDATSCVRRIGLVARTDMEPAKPGP